MSEKIIYDDETGKHHDITELMHALGFEKVITCKDCRRRSVDCPLSVWAGPHDDDFCSRAEPKEERDK